MNRIRRFLKFVPVQPVPTDVALARIAVCRHVVSAITRTWKPGDTERCRLCPVCTASGNLCTILVTAPVPATHQEAGLFDATDLRWASGGGH